MFKSFLIVFLMGTIASTIYGLHRDEKCDETCDGHKESRMWLLVPAYIALGIAFIGGLFEIYIGYLRIFPRTVA